MSVRRCLRRAAVFVLTMPAIAHAEEPLAPSPIHPSPVPSPPPAAVPVAPPTSASTAEAEEIARALATDSAGATSQEPARPAEPGWNAAAFLPDISIILDVAGAVFSDDEPMQAGEHDPNSTGFHLQQLELSLGKSVDPYFRFDGNLVFTLEGVDLEEAYASTLSLPLNLQVRAGKFQTKFGRVNATHPHQWDFVDQPLMLGKIFGGEGNRGVGVELSHLTPLPWYVELIGSSTSASGEGTARSFLSDAEDAAVQSPLDLQNTLALKQFFPLHDNWSLLWGISAANGPNPHAVDGRTDIFGTDLFIKYRPITEATFTAVALQTEWLLRRKHVGTDIEQDVLGYTQLTWRFAQRWATGARYEFTSPTVSMVHGGVVRDVLDPDQTSSRHRTSLAMSFLPTEFSRLRLQGSVDDARWRDRSIAAAFLALEIVTGTHGAHQF